MKNKLLLLLIAATFVLGSCKKEDDENPNIPAGTNNDTTGTPTTNKTFEFKINNTLVTADTVNQNLGTATVNGAISIKITIEAFDADYTFEFGDENAKSYPDNWVENDQYCNSFSPFAFNLDKESVTIKKGEKATIQLSFNPGPFNFSVFEGYDHFCNGNDCATIPVCRDINSTGEGTYNSIISVSYSINNISKTTWINLTGTGEIENEVIIK